MAVLQSSATIPMAALHLSNRTLLFSLSCCSKLLLRSRELLKKVSPRWGLNPRPPVSPLRSWVQCPLRKHLCKIGSGCAVGLVGAMPLPLGSFAITRTMGVGRGCRCCCSRLSRGVDCASVLGRTPGASRRSQQVGVNYVDAMDASRGVALQAPVHCGEWRSKLPLHSRERAASNGSASIESSPVIPMAAL